MADFEPRIIAFCCNWCTYAAADLAGTSRVQYPANVRIIRVMCSGMVNPIYVFKAFEGGADGVLIAGCHLSDCHYIDGPTKCDEAVEKMRRMLHVLGLEDVRLRREMVAASEGGLFAQVIREMVEELKKLGPSPFRESRRVGGRESCQALADVMQETKSYYCLECSKCTSICPVARYDPSYSPRAVIENAELGLYSENTGDKKLFSCLSCYACSLRCPSDVDYPSFMQRMRAMAFESGEHGCPAHGGVLHSVTRLMSISSYKQNRLDWLSKEHRISDKSDVLFWVGCAPYFEPIFEDLEFSALDIARASLKTMNLLGIEPKLLSNERCCGHDALWTGDIETFKKLAEHNAAQIKEAGVKKIVFSCPEGYRTFKMDYPDHVDLDCEVLHLSELVAEKIEENDLKLKEVKKKVTYQDPCRLGRHMGIYDAPRKVIESIPGIELIEMEHSGRESICCGTSAFTNCDAYSNALRAERLSEARATGADILITACPKCQTHLKCAMTDRGEEHRSIPKIEIMDLANLVAEAIE